MSRPIKGLIIKDLRLILSQMKLFMIVIIVWAFFMTVNLKGTFLIGYIAIMFSFITLGTFNYDEIEKGMSYLLTLPVQRKDYIKEKYLLGMMITIIPTLIVIVFTCVFYIVKNAEKGLLTYLFSSIIAILSAIVLMVLEIPLYIKFGQEKRRLVTILSIAIMGACIGMLASLYETAGGNNAELIHNILDMNIGLLLLLIILAVIVLTIISYKISCLFLEKKQF
ncbi:MAG: ABC-2 transporter permease [Lachnospiraceae bacterium]|nr:ABC-2 transporter permease [Lachnospiraceae bacterium]